MNQRSLDVVDERGNDNSVDYDLLSDRVLSYTWKARCRTDQY